MSLTLNLTLCCKGSQPAAASESLQAICLPISQLDLFLTGVESLKAVLPERLPTQYPYLEYLQIVGTGLSGTFPAAWFSEQAWRFLIQFDFDSNPALQGALPAPDHQLCRHLFYCEVANAIKVIDT